MKKWSLVFLVLVCALVSYGGKGCGPVEPGPAVTVEPETSETPVPVVPVVPLLKTDDAAQAIIATSVTLSEWFKGTVVEEEGLDVGTLWSGLFAATEAGCVRGGVWDQVYSGKTLKSWMGKADGLVTAGLGLSGLGEYVLFDKDSPFYDGGIDITLAMVDSYIYAIEDGDVTVWELFSIPVEGGEEAMILGGKWNVVLWQISPETAPVYGRDLWNNSLALLTSGANMAGVKDLVVFRVEDPAAVRKLVIDHFPSLGSEDPDVPGC